MVEVSLHSPLVRIVLMGERGERVISIRQSEFDFAAFFFQPQFLIRAGLWSEEWG